MNLSRFFALILVIVFNVPAICSFGGKRLEFEKITVDDGLSSNTVLDIAQDHDGRIWFATYNGLTYFDGIDYHEVKSSFSAEEGKLPNDKPEDIAVDHDGNIWVLYEGTRLVRLLDTSGRCREYKVDNRSAGNHFSLDLDDGQNLLLVDSLARFKYDRHTDKLVPFTGHYTSPTVIMEEIRDHLTQYFPDVEPYSFFQDRKKHALWVSTLKYGVIKIPDGDYSRLDVYSTKSLGNSAISGNETYCVFVDKNGVVWIGTKDNGVNKGLEVTNSFNTLGLSTLKMPHGAIRSIWEDHIGQLWLGTYNQGVWIFKDGKASPVRFRNDQDNKWNWIRYLFQSSDGTMWIGSYAGLCAVDPVTLKTRYFGEDPENRNTISKKRIYSIVEDRKHNLFVGEWGALDYYDRRKKTFTRIDSRSELKNRHIRKLMLSSKGELWVGTENKGVFVIDTASFDVLKHYDDQFREEAASLNSNSIFEIYEDGEENIWIGTFGGLNRIDHAGNIQSFPLINKRLPSSLIYRIFKVKDNKLWCSTIKGIVQVDIDRDFVRSYNHMDGVDIAEFSEGAGFRNANNKIYFGGGNGICSFNPDSVPVNYFVPDVVLNRLDVNGEKYRISNISEWTDPVDLSSWEQDFSFHIQSILVNNPYHTKLGWKLIPKDNDFHFGNGPRITVNYDGLAAGHYRLLVKAANADGIWSQSKSLLSFNIEKPFWENFYFIFILLCLIASVAVLVAQFRLKQIKRQNKRLEELVDKRTQKVEKQKIELEKTNAELAREHEKVLSQKDQILAQRDHLLEIYDKLEESNRLKENFFTNISHDIRTPLSLIYAPVCEIIKEQPAESPLKEKLTLIRSNINYIIQLLDQVLDKKRMEAGGLEKIFTLGDVVALCRSTIRSFEEEAASNDIRLCFSSDQAFLKIRFDYGKLKQIVFNILSNALKFTPGGGEIHCSLTVGEESVKLEIRDTGIGIPESRIKYIFDRYYQVGKASNPGNRGVGIGLSLVKEFVDLLGGTIGVSSQEGKGSCFTITFPYQKNLAEAETTEPEETNLEIVPDGPEADALTETERTSDDLILLVEDNDDFRDYLHNYLSRHFTVKAFENGKKALKFIKKNQAVKMIISDWIMPEMDGIELCQAIRKKKRLRSVPFILLTALSDVENEKEGYFAGIDDFISKPFDPEILYLKIFRLLEMNKTIKSETWVDGMTEPKNEAVESYDDKMLKRIMSVVGREFSKPDFDPDILAREAGLSQMQLYRKLKEITRMTPTEFIRSVRIKRAKQLLEDERIMINEISDMIGFNDPKYFSRSFSKETGMSPSQYRKSFLEKTDVSF